MIQSDGQSVQWKGWFTANDLSTPATFGLAFDRSFMAISAPVDGLGVVLESTLLAERELASGKLVSPLRMTSNSVRYVGHYLVHPRRHRQHENVTRFKNCCSGSWRWTRPSFVEQRQVAGLQDPGPGR